MSVLRFLVEHRAEFAALFLQHVLLVGASTLAAVTVGTLLQGFAAVAMLLVLSTLAALL